MEPKFFSQKNIFEMMRTNDRFLVKYQPNMYMPIIKDARYMVQYAKGLGKAKDSAEEVALLNSGETVMQAATMFDIVESVAVDYAEGRIDGAEPILNAWDEYLDFVKNLQSTYDDVIDEIYMHDNEDTEGGYRPYIFGECIHAFYNLLMNCLCVEIPWAYGEEHVIQPLTELFKYFFDELIPTYQKGFSNSEASEIHHKMLGQFYRLYSLVTTYYH